MKGDGDLHLLLGGGEVAGQLADPLVSIADGVVVNLQFPCRLPLVPAAPYQCLERFEKLLVLPQAAGTVCESFAQYRLFRKYFIDKKSLNIFFSYKSA